MPRAASADGGPKQCISAYENGQVAQQKGQLRRARASFLSCMDESCPELLRKDCHQWMEQVLTAMPTVVIIVHDPNGADVVGSRLWVDGEPVAWTEGTPVEIDPGAHHLRLEADGWPALEKRLVVRDGDKRRKLEFRLEAASTPVPTAAYVIGGAGVLALGVSAYLGIQGLRLRSDLEDSNCSPRCSQSDVDRTMKYFHWADAFLAVGVVSVGVATYMFLDRPAAAGADKRAGLGLRFSAHANASGAGANLGLRF